MRQAMLHEVGRPHREREAPLVAPRADRDVEEADAVHPFAKLIQFPRVTLSHPTDAPGF